MTDSPTSKEEIQSPALPARQTSPILRWSLIGAGAVGLYALAGFVAVPALIKSRLPEFAGQTLKRKASLGEISINPFTLCHSLRLPQVHD